MPTAGNGGMGGTPSGGSGGAGGSGGSGGSDSGGSGGAGGSGGSGGSGGMDPDEDGGVEDDASTPDELPMDGEALSVCESTDDCTGEDLVCAVFGANRGYCTQGCQAAEDCDAVDGIEPICDDDDECVIDCEVDGAPDGECPEQMECVEVTPAPLADPIFRCQYPAPKDVEEYGACNPERGDDDCKGDLTCQMFPGLTDLREPYCTAGCEEPSDCDDMGSEATPVCDTSISLEGVCALECEEDDQCPDGLTCVFVDALAMRCGTEIE